MADHTPGPWQFGATQNGYWMVTHGANMLVTGLDYKKDAQVMAAAPDMHATLKNIATQKTTDEMDEQENEDADFVGAYDALIHIARRALQPLT